MTTAWSAGCSERARAGPRAARPPQALGLPSTLAARWPDIAAAAAQLHAATASVGIAVAELYPRVMLGAGYGSVSVGASNFATSRP